MIALISFALTRYFPQFVVFSLNRTRYYVIGSDVVKRDMAFIGLKKAIALKH